jgi:hypothetical protein
LTLIVNDTPPAMWRMTTEGSAVATGGPQLPVTVDISAVLSPRGNPWSYSADMANIFDKTEA